MKNVKMSFLKKNAHRVHMKASTTLQSKPTLWSKPLHPRASFATGQAKAKHQIGPNFHLNHQAAFFRISHSSTKTLGRPHPSSPYKVIPAATRSLSSMSFSFQSHSKWPVQSRFDFNPTCWIQYPSKLSFNHKYISHHLKSAQFHSTIPYQTEDKKKVSIFEREKLQDPLPQNYENMDRDDLQEVLDQKLYSQHDKIYTIPNLKNATKFPLCIDETQRVITDPSSECERGKDDCFERVVISTLDPDQVSGELDDIQLNFFEYPLAIDGWRCPQCAKLVFPANVAETIVQKLLMTALYYNRIGNHQLSEWYYRRAGNAAPQKTTVRTLVGNFYFEAIQRMKEQEQINQILFRRYATYAVEAFEVALKYGLDLEEDKQARILSEVTLLDRAAQLYNDELGEKFKAEAYYEKIRDIVRQYPELDQHILRRHAQIQPEDVDRQLTYAVKLLRPWLSLPKIERKNQETPEREGMRKAFVMLDQILKQDETVHQAYLWKFRVQTAMELFEEALVSVSLAVRYAPDPNLYLYEEAIASKNIHDLDSAVEKAEKMVELQSDFQSVGFLAVLYLEAGRYDEAQEAAQAFGANLNEQQLESMARISKTAAFAKTLNLSSEKFQEWLQKNDTFIDYDLETLTKFSKKNR